MLRGTNNQNLLEAALSENHIIFYQIWRELTENKTFDSYQYKSTNILNGIRELIHNILSYLDGTICTTHSLDAVREELLALLKKDPVMEENFPSLKRRLASTLGKKYDSNSHLKALKYQLQCYYFDLGANYDAALTQKLTTAVESQSPDQYILTSQFISRCVDLGWSIMALSKKIDALKDETAHGNIQNFLSKIINAKEQSYAIFLPFRLKISPKDGESKAVARNAVIQQLKTFEIEVKNCSQIISAYPTIDSTKLKDTQDYMIVTAEALDVFSASHSAILKLSRILNILSFFTTIESWAVNDITLTAYNTESPYTKCQKASDIYKTYEYLDSSSKVYTRTAQFISENAPTHPLSQKLLSSFSYANLSRSSMALEEKYMNMWIAIESLCRIDTYENIIDSVITLVPNAVSLRYPYRLVRNFVEDCNRCEVSFAFSTKTINPKAANKEKLVTEIIEIFHNSELYAELLDKCRCNSLLHHRCMEIYQFLNDEQVFISKITHHHTTVVWHLNRLYRIRNEIAHSASMQGMATIRYTEHLYDYLAIVVSEIMRFSETKGLDTLGEIFAIINDSYAEFYDLSTAKKPLDKKAALGKLWKTGIMNYL